MGQTTVILKDSKETRTHLAVKTAETCPRGRAMPGAEWGNTVSKREQKKNRCQGKDVKDGELMHRVTAWPKAFSTKGKKRCAYQGVRSSASPLEGIESGCFKENRGRLSYG